MAVVYLVLLLGWLLTVAVARGVVHQRRTGSVPVWVGDRRWEPQWWARRLGALGLLSAFAAPLADLAGLDRFTALDHEGVAVAGVVLVIAGIAITVFAQVVMGDSWRGDVDPDVFTDLVVSGPFRWVRNPIAVATTTTLVGLALVLPDAFAAAAIVLSIMSLQLQVRFVEEQHLERVHGRRYLAYAERTGRFLPGIGRHRSG